MMCPSVQNPAFGVYDMEALNGKGSNRPLGKGRFLPVTAYHPQHAKGFTHQCTAVKKGSEAWLGGWAGARTGDCCNHLVKSANNSGSVGGLACARMHLVWFTFGSR